MAMNSKPSNHFLSKDGRSKIIKVTQSDYTYPETFEELLPESPQISRYLNEEYNGHCSRLQSSTIKLITSMPYRNLLAQALSGSSKEVCYIASIYERLSLRKQVIPQAIVICPTNEVAKRIKSLFVKVGRHDIEYSVKMVYDDDLDSRESITEDLVIGLPSTLKNVIESRDVDLSDVKMVILEESDSILKEQMEADVSWILKRIKRVQAMFQVVIFYSSMTDKLRQFVPEIAPTHNLNSMYYNEEEYSVFNTKLFKFPVVDDDDRIKAVCHLLEVLERDNMVVIYVKQDRNVRMLVKKLEDMSFSVFQAKVKDQIKGGGSYDVLITSYPVPSFDRSKVIATIFFDIPIAFDGNELYYRLATRVDAYCEQGIGAVVSRSVFHLVSRRDVDRMNQIENYFGRRVKQLVSVTSYDGFVDLIDVLLKADVIDATRAATLRRGAKNCTLGPLALSDPYCDEVSDEDCRREW